MEICLECWACCCRAAADRRDQSSWECSGSDHAAAGEPAAASGEEGRGGPGLHALWHQTGEEQHYTPRSDWFRFVSRQLFSVGTPGLWFVCNRKCIKGYLIIVSVFFINRKNIIGTNTGTLSWCSLCDLRLHHTDSSWIRGRRHRVGHRQTSARCQLLSGESTARWAVRQELTAGSEPYVEAEPGINHEIRPGAYKII